MAIGQKTWQQLLDAIFVMNAADNHSSFGEAVVAGLSRLVVADVTIFQVLDRKTQRLVTHVSPPMPYTEEEVAYYAAHSEENPLATSQSSPSPPPGCFFSPDFAYSAVQEDRITGHSPSNPTPKKTHPNEP